MKQIILLLLVVPAFTSCYHVYYAPNTANAPQLTQKGETRINALYASGGDSEYGGGELQFAHAIDDHAAIMVNGFSVGRSEQVTEFNNNSSHTEKGKGSYLELGGGLFTTVDARKRWVGEIYAGFGSGATKSDYGYGDRSKVGFHKFFLQPSFGYKTNYFEFALVPRLSLVNWKVKEDRITATENQDMRDNMVVIGRDPSFVTFEPTFLVRAGAKNFKLQGALSFSNYRSEIFISDGLVESLNASIGVSINVLPYKK